MERFEGDVMEVSEIAEYYHQIVMDALPEEYEDVAQWASDMVRMVVNEQ